MEDERNFFLPGMVVTLRLDIPNKPTMIVVKKETTIIKKNKDGILKGIKCRWFTTSGELLEAIFNTKDLIKL